MKVITNHTIPETGEWILSTEPDHFAITLFNDSGLLTDYDRLTALVVIEDRVGDGETPDRSLFRIAIVGIRSLDGKLPGENLDKHPQVKEMAQNPVYAKKISAALDLWATTITEDEKVEVWLGANHNDPLSLLQAIVGK